MILATLSAAFKSFPMIRNRFIERGIVLEQSVPDHGKDSPNDRLVVEHALTELTSDAPPRYASRTFAAISRMATSISIMRCAPFLMPVQRSSRQPEFSPLSMETNLCRSGRSSSFDKNVQYWGYPQEVLELWPHSSCPYHRRRESRRNGVHPSSPLYGLADLVHCVFISSWLYTCQDWDFATPRPGRQRIRSEDPMYELTLGICAHSFRSQTRTSSDDISGKSLTLSDRPRIPDEFIVMKPFLQILSSRGVQRKYGDRIHSEACIACSGLLQLAERTHACPFSARDKERRG